MSTLADDFDSGTPGDDIATRSGWSTAGANFDVKVSDANGVYGTNAAAGSGRGGAGFDTGSGDQFAELDMVALTPNSIGPAVRIQDEFNWLGVYLGGVGGGGLRSYRKLSGSRTDLTTEQGVAGKTYRLEVIDVGGGNSELGLFEDGVLMNDGQQTVSNTDYPVTNTFAGIMNDGTNTVSSHTYWDNFSGGDIGGGGGPSTIVVFRRRIEGN